MVRVKCTVQDLALGRSLLISVCLLCQLPIIIVTLNQNFSINILGQKVFVGGPSCASEDVISIHSLYLLDVNSTSCSTVSKNVCRQHQMFPGG